MLDTILAIPAGLFLLVLVWFGIRSAIYILSGQYEMDQRLDDLGRW